MIVEIASMGESPLNNYYAILAESPLMRLGIQQFIHDLQPDFACLLMESSFFSLPKELMVSANIGAIIYLDGAEPAIRNTVLQILLLCNQYPQLNIGIYTGCRDVTLLALLNDRPQISLIDQHQSLVLIRQDFAMWLAGCKVCSVGIAQCFDLEPSLIRSDLYALTRAERRVLKLLFTGCSVTEIARLSHRSIKTISAHKCNCMRKLGVSNDAALFRLSLNSREQLEKSDGYQGNVNGHAI